MSTRGKANRGALQRTVNRTVRGKLHVDKIGRRFTPTPIPKQIVQAPWNTFILSSSITKETVITVKDVAQNIFRGLGMFVGSKEEQLLNDLKMSLRVQRLEVWEMTGEPIMVIIRSFIEAGRQDKEEITCLENLAGRMSFARVGYEWPSAHQMVTFHSDDDSGKNLFSVHFSQEKQSGIAEIRLHCLWKGTIRAFPQYSVSAMSLPE